MPTLDRYRSDVRVRRDCSECRVPKEFVTDGRPSPSILAATSKVGFAVGHKAGGAGCPYARYGLGKICDGCYAKMGRKDRQGKRLAPGQYAKGAALRANTIRLTWATASMMTDDGMDAWAQRVAHAIIHDVRPTHPYIRAFDSGDFLNHRHVRAWARVADLIHPIHIWDPTRAWRAIYQDDGTPKWRHSLLWDEAFAAFNSRPNVTCRPSALEYDTLPPSLRGFAAGAAVVTDRLIFEAWKDAGHDVYLCPAGGQGGRCDGRAFGGIHCQACHNRPNAIICYPAHGRV